MALSSGVGDLADQPAGIVDDGHFVAVVPGVGNVSSVCQVVHPDDCRRPIDADSPNDVRAVDNRYGTEVTSRWPVPALVAYVHGARQSVYPDAERLVADADGPDHPVRVAVDNRNCPSGLAVARVRDIDGVAGRHDTYVGGVRADADGACDPVGVAVDDRDRIGAVVTDVDHVGARVDRYARRVVPYRDGGNDLRRRTVRVGPAVDNRD